MRGKEHFQTTRLVKDFKTPFQVVCLDRVGPSLASKKERKSNPSPATQLKSSVKMTNPGSASSRKTQY